jgi:Coenzyme PQQ synthesis protein D (PqqD)
MTGSVPGAPRARVRQLDIDGEITLYDGEHSNALVLNTTASDVWRLLDGHRSIEEIVQLLSIAYNAPEEVVRTDVERTVREFAERHLLENATG